VAYEDVIAVAPPEVRAFADRLIRWVDAHGWSTETTDKGLKLCTEDGVYVCRFQPTLENVEVDLRRFRRRELDDVADDLAARLSDFADEDLTQRSVQVPLTAIDRRWDDFFEVFLPQYVDKVRDADRTGPDPGPGLTYGPSGMPDLVD
jgi:hypothetical protein